MLLRTGFLLLLCLSSGWGATLGLFQAQEKEVEADPVEPAAAVTDDVAAAVVASEEPDVATDSQVGDPPATEAPVINSPLSDEPLPKTPEVEEESEGDKAQEELQPADSEEAEEPTEEPKVEVDGSPEDPVTEGLPEVKVVTQDQPSTEPEETNEIKPVETNENLDKPSVQEDESSWGLNSIRGTFQSMHGYFDSLVELVGGHNGVCQYRCSSDLPQPRPGYQLPEPNGCSSSLVGFQLDLGVPAMTKCCNQIDMCYDTCGNRKYDCDSNFRSCLHDICSDLKKSLGFEAKVQACESMADALFNTVWTLGCRPYMNSQRAACYCKGEEKDEL